MSDNTEGNIKTFKTMSVVTGRHTTREYDQRHYDRWIEHIAWFERLIDLKDSGGLKGVHYLYKDGHNGRKTCIAVASSAPANTLEINLGWLHELEPSFYWSCYRWLSDVFGEDYFVTADEYNSNIWIA